MYLKYIWSNMEQKRDCTEENISFILGCAAEMILKQGAGFGSK